MFFSQAPSAARPAIIETKFNPFSIVKAGLVSEMMDDGLLMYDACRKAGMSSATYRHALLAGKAQPPKRAFVHPARFSAKTVAKYLSMERLMARGFLQSHAAAEVGASSECYSIWRLQTDGSAVQAPVLPSKHRYDPVQTITEEVRDFAAEQRQQVAAKNGERTYSRAEAIKEAVRLMRAEHPGMGIGTFELDGEDITAEAHAALAALEKEGSQDQSPAAKSFADLDAKARAAFSGGKVVHGSANQLATEINVNGLGSDWHIRSMERTSTSLVVKATLSDRAQDRFNAAKQAGGGFFEGLQILTALQSLDRNCISEEWPMDKIEGGLSGITVTASRAEKTKEQLDEEKLLEMVAFLQRGHGGGDLSGLAGVLSDFDGGDAYQRALRAMKATRH